ncbi:hypothetical protein B0A49_10878, partial [Cryomyces minteri]
NGVDDRTGEEEREKLWGGEVVGLNPNIRVYRYRKGQFFDQHYDDANTLTLPLPPQHMQQQPGRSSSI